MHRREVYFAVPDQFNERTEGVTRLSRQAGTPQRQGRRGDPSVGTVLYCAVLDWARLVGGIAGEEEKKGWEHGQLALDWIVGCLFPRGRLSFGCGCGRDGWMGWGLSSTLR